MKEAHEKSTYSNSELDPFCDAKREHNSVDLPIAEEISLTKYACVLSTGEEVQTH